MSNIIPPLLSSTPPPIGNIDDEDDDFGDFTTAVDYPYGCDSFSIPSTPQDGTPKKAAVDINSNSSLNRITEKDHQDKRKHEPPTDQQLSHLPNLSPVPSEPKIDSKATVGSAPVPEVKTGLKTVTGDNNVPSYHPAETEDVYREEPPEIIPDDPDDDFGDFEYNAGLSIENEDEEINIDMSIPISNDLPEVADDFAEETISNKFAGGDKIIEDSSELVKEFNEINIIHSTENTVKTKEIITDSNEIKDDDYTSCKNEHSTEDDYTNSEGLFNGDGNKTSSDDDDDFGDFEFTTTNIEVDFRKDGETNFESPGVNIPVNLKSTNCANSDFKNPDLLEVKAINNCMDAAPINWEDAPLKTSTDLDAEPDLTPPIFETNVNTAVDRTSTEEHIPTNDDFGDFADFSSIETKNPSGPPATEDADDFGDFVAPSPEIKDPNDSPAFEATFPSFGGQDDDEFGDFDGYASATSSVVLAIDSKNVPEKAKAILEEMFEVGKAEYDDYHTFDFIGVDGVFKEMKDITDTNALRYQWAKSQSQKELLKSLNIDTRNILYGPGINSMPKFAANLGLTPLEPMKSEILAPTQILTPSTSSQSNPAPTSTEIPTAQFDWSESGLANPLDSVSKEEENQNSEPADSPSNFAQSNPPIATPRKSFDNESVNSLQFADIPNEEDAKVTEEDQFSDFTSFKTEKKEPTWSGNMVPLRESYINNMEIKRDSEEPGWLKPTILTPVLPRKESEKFELEEDEFTDFQMSLPPTNPSSSLTVLPMVTNAQNEKTSEIVVEKDAPFNPSNILQPVQIFKPMDNQSASNGPALINWPDPGITEEELARFEMYSKSNGEVKKASEPKVIGSQIVQRSDSQVERKLSGNTGLMLVEKSVVVPANKVVLPSKEVLLPPNDKVVISKDLVLPILDSSPRKYTPLKNQSKHDDEDDWTDFISNPEPIKPVHKFSQPTERTATPELPLSIPQLSHIQPPKLPIPVITPQGLMQTKIPSMPTLQPKHAQTPLHLNPPQDGYQPAIISHQYAMQMNQNTFSGLLQNASYQTTSIPANMRTPTHQPANGIKSSSSFDDSDEWSEFVSSRPTSNGLPNPLGADWNRSPQFNNWNSPMQYQQFTLQSNGTAHSIKNNIPSISALPDLDFVAPKTRTYSKK